MPIEFRCNQCGKLLRTGDETAGRQAQCPECGALSKVPGLADATAAPPPLAPLGGQSSASPGAAPGSPFSAGPQFGGATGSENPYQSPGSYTYRVPPGQADPVAAQRVAGPAIALMVIAILGMLWDLFVIIGYVNFIFVAAGAAAQGGEPFPVAVFGGIGVAFGILGLAIGALILIGAIKMKKLQSYGLAMTSAIAGMIPCYWPCCLLGLPFGIWALVVLSDSSVKAAFRS